MSAEENRASLQRAVAHFNDPASRAACLELDGAEAVLHGYQGVEAC